MRTLLAAILWACAIQAADAATECFVYDELGRLKSSVHTGVKVVAYDLDAAGNRENLNTTTPTDSTAPGAPTGLTATALSSTQVQLDWNEPADNVCVAAYIVQRCTGASCSNYATIATVLTPRYLNTGLTGSTTYRYRVRAQDTSGNNGAFSSVVTITTPVGIPAAPTVTANFSMVLEGASYTIFWTSVSGATEYQLFRSINSTGFSLFYQGTALSRIINNATVGEYTYRAQACNANGCSANSNEVTVLVCTPAGCL